LLNHRRWQFDSNRGQDVNTVVVENFEVQLQTAFGTDHEYALNVLRQGNNTGVKDVFALLTVVQEGTARLLNAKGSAGSGHDVLDSLTSLVRGHTTVRTAGNDIVLFQSKAIAALYAIGDSDRIVTRAQYTVLELSAQTAHRTLIVVQPLGVRLSKDSLDDRLGTLVIALDVVEEFGHGIVTLRLGQSLGVRRLGSAGR
jgi:hypothetical protein